MGINSKIEWTDNTWNPWRGCTKLSPACDNCYMMRDAARFGLNGQEVTRASPATFNAPLKMSWMDGTRVFVCSWSDFFHAAADAWRVDAWEIIRKRPGLIFQILTKRPERITQCLPEDWGDGWPNVWLGVTAENQEFADKRIPWLLAIPAAKRFVSIEPMLGAVDLTRLSAIRAYAPELYKPDDPCAPDLKWNALSEEDGYNDAFATQTGEEMALLDWVIVGGESGPAARPMHPDWARKIRDQCQAAGVPFFFKQWGEWGPYVNEAHYVAVTDGCERRPHAWIDLETGDRGDCYIFDDDGIWTNWTGSPRLLPDSEGEVHPGIAVMGRHGKKENGCIIDGREWKEFPV